MTAARSRDRAIRLARTDPTGALAAARAIADPRYRAQALACTARHTPGTAARAVLQEARAASRAADDPYRVVASSAWWLSAMIDLGLSEDAAAELDGVLARAATIAHPVSRLDALFLVLQAVFRIDAARRRALDALLAACRAARSWKAGARLRDAALMLAGDHPAEAERVLGSMPEGAHRRQATRRVEQGDRLVPRAFCAGSGPVL